MVLTRDLIEVDVVTLDYLYAYVTTVFDRIQSLCREINTLAVHIVSNVPSRATSAFRLEEMASSQGHGSTYPVHVISWIWKCRDQ
jgi:hypothetical protein